MSKVDFFISQIIDFEGIKIKRHKKPFFVKKKLVKTNLFCKKIRYIDSFRYKRSLSK